MNEVEFEDVTVTELRLVSFLELENLFGVFDLVPNIALGTGNDVRHGELN